jgi:ribosome-associated protein
MTATPEAIEMATLAARAAASKLADDVVVIDVSDQLVITDCFVIASWCTSSTKTNAISMRSIGFGVTARS